MTKEKEYNYCEAHPTSISPHRCPICGGRGFVMCGFYNSHNTNEWLTTGGTEQCRTCNGEGVVWG